MVEESAWAGTRTQPWPGPGPKQRQRPCHQPGPWPGRLQQREGSEQTQVIMPLVMMSSSAGSEGGIPSHRDVVAVTHSTDIITGWLLPHSSDAYAEVGW